MSKYYTPEKEEFYVGFECEILNGFGEWKHIPIEISHFTLNEVENLKEWRVKYLDRADIESLGFEFQGGNDYYWLRYFNGEYILSQATEVLKEEIYFNLTIEKNGDFYFQGTIKNKSELKKILKWIGV